MSGGWIDWPAPAKINRFLHVTGRRVDGYHELQTVFQLLDWGDTVRLRPRDDAAIVRCNPLPGVAAAQDLAVRAALLLAAESGKRDGVDIDIDKRIPLGGGLGGGSSDAATVLVALNAMWRCGFDTDALAALGLRLGADVPVFVKGHSAFAGGVGEQLTVIELPERWFLVVDPGARVSTAEAFQAPELTRETPATTISRFLAGEPTCNVFQSVVRHRHPAVAQALDWLGTAGEPRLSGTGASVFLMLDDAGQGDDLLARMPAGMVGWVVRGINRSPLLDAVRRWLPGD